MNDPLLVCGMHGAGQRLDEPGSGLRGLWSAVKTLFQTWTVDVLHGEKRPAVDLTQVVKLHNMRML